MPHIGTMTAEEAARKLRDLGMNTSPQAIRRGLESGAYTFGDCFSVDKRVKATVYTTLLDKWIEERLVEDSE